MTVRILLGDVLDRLRALPDASVHCVVTSPPYWGLRDYGALGQIGLESTYQEHLSALVSVFEEVRRVLRPDGTCWVNYGDAYASTPNGRPAALIVGDDRAFRDKPMSTVGGALKPKDACLLPHRLAIALQEAGWWVRADIVWAKPNPMPGSVRDRPTSSHEYVFLLSRSPRYFYDDVAIREPAAAVPGGSVGKYSFARAAHKQGGGKAGQKPQHRPDRAAPEAPPATRSARSVWTIATEAFSEAHFATMPTELARRCILAGTSQGGVCPRCGTPWRRLTASDSRDAAGLPAGDQAARRMRDGHVPRLAVAVSTRGWVAACGCLDHLPKPAVVLDPFGGAGTTGLVADRLGRDAVLIEINPEYAEIARRRISGDGGMYAQCEVA